MVVILTLMSSVLLLEQIEVNGVRHEKAVVHISPLTFSTSDINCDLKSNKILLGLVLMLAHCDCIYDIWSAAAWRF